jgi:NADPH2:quinone reductase
MQAIRVHPVQPPSPPYSPSNPAPSTALHLDNIPIPHPTKPGELLVHIKATTIIRDMLTWPETYAHDYIVPGNDFAGTVVEIFPGGEESAFNIGDEVFGMVHADRPSTWAEYAIVLESEVALKPKGVGWEGAAALPLSGMTAFEALFDHAGLSLLQDGDVEARKENEKKEVLITGAAGGVGIYLVQLAASTGLRVIAASSSNARNEEFLRELGAHEVVAYSVLEGVKDRFDIIIDTVGGETLAQCWGYVKDGGSLISVDSGSFNFLEEHGKRGIVRDGVKALFFIIRGSTRALHALAESVDRGMVKSFVAGTYPIAKVREAYDFANGRFTGRGKVILTL